MTRISKKVRVPDLAVMKEARRTHLVTLTPHMARC